MAFLKPRAKTWPQAPGSKILSLTCGSGLFLGKWDVEKSNVKGSTVVHSQAPEVGQGGNEAPGLEAAAVSS